MSRRTTIVVALVLAAGLLVLVPRQGVYVQLLVGEVLALGLVAVSFDLLFGFTGLLSVGQALYFGVGAYALTFAVSSFRMPAWQGVVLAIVAAGLFALVTGFISIRVRGHSFMIVTLIFSTVFYLFAQNWKEVTGGDDGLILEAQRLALFGLGSGSLSRYYVVVGAVVLAVAATAVLVHSPLGVVLRSVKQNERRAQFLGFNTPAIKLFAFCWAGMLAGLGGALHVMLFQHAHTALLHWTVSANALVWTLFGGQGTLLGGVLGAAVLIPLENALGSWVGYPRFFIGCLVVVMVLTNRGGVLGLLWEMRRWSGRLAA